MVSHKGKGKSNANIHREWSHLNFDISPFRPDAPPGPPLLTPAPQNIFSFESVLADMQAHTVPDRFNVALIQQPSEILDPRSIRETTHYKELPLDARTALEAQQSLIQNEIKMAHHIATNMFPLREEEMNQEQIALGKLMQARARTHSCKMMVDITKTQLGAQQQMISSLMDEQKRNDSYMADAMLVAEASKDPRSEKWDFCHGTEINYFIGLAERLQKQMASYERAIDDIHAAIQSKKNAQTTNDQDVMSVLENQIKVSMALASQIMLFHQQVEELSSNYSN
ncbi:hypothetical protein BC940DRAFT_333293 [Gongronella butleri]|nr:hypothetical protein BC940DRAFT_333293 [Gongronella butleri]